MESPLTPAEIIKLITEETEKVFSTMLGLPIELRPAAEDPGNEASGRVIAFLGFAGDWSGSGSIQCSAKLACSISAKLLLMDFDRVNEDVLDAIGEIANMIIGNFKDDAAYKLGPLGLSTPTVIHGTNFQARNWNGQSWTTVPFTCEGEIFEVKISLVQTNTLREPLRPAVMLGP